MEHTADAAETPVNLAPVLSPEQITENLKKQEEWKKYVQIPDFLLSGQASWQKRDSILTGDLVKTIIFLEDELEKIADPVASNQIITVLIRKRDELAEIYARRGDFGLAANIAATPARIELYTEYFNAAERPATEKCIHQGKDDYFEFYPVKTAIDDKLAMIRCNKCGFRNLRKPTRAELEKFNGKNS